MSRRPSLQALCVLLILCSVVGIFYLQADVSTDSPITPAMSPQAPVTDDVVKASGDFYQTLIDNNLFAPLGTQLHQKPRPGENLKLLGTFLAPDAGRSTALIKQASTGRLLTVTVGDVLGDATVMKIESKQVTLDAHGKKPVVLRLPSNVLLNPKRR